MHVERNVTKNVLRTIMGEKDTASVREDMRALAIRPWLWLQERADVPMGSKLKPHAPYVLLPVDKKVFLSCIQKLRVPTGYSACMRKHVVNGKLQSLKSHDVHVLSQQILPMAIRHVLHPSARTGIIRLSIVFQRVCAKEVKPSELEWLKQYAAETLCILE